MKFQRANLRGAWLPCILLLLCQCSGSRSTEADYLITGFPALDSLVANSPMMVYDLNGEPDHVITITDEHIWFADNDTVANITGLSRMDSLIIVVDSGYNRVHALRETGETMWSYGRTGKGPGEFEMVNWVSGRSVPTFYDAKLHRLTECTVSMMVCHSEALRYAPEVLPSRIRIFLTENIYMHRNRVYDPDYSSKHFMQEKSMKELYFFRPVKSEYNEIVYNSMKIADGRFGNDSFVLGYQAIPYAFLYDSNFHVKSIIHYKYEKDKSIFPVALTPRKERTDLTAMHYTVLSILSNHVFVIQRDFKLYFMDIRTPGKPIATLRIEYPNTEKMFSVKEIVRLNDHLYIHTNNSGIIHRFNMKGILPGG